MNRVVSDFTADATGVLNGLRATKTETGCEVLTPSPKLL